MLDFKIKTSPSTKQCWLETSIQGKQLLTLPQLNKGTAFSAEERETFHLTGKLPAHIETIDEQADRVYRQFQEYDTPLQKNNFLNQLHDTNQTLFYKLVMSHASEMIPILYTPTVGIAVEKFSREFQHARGLYISYEDRYKIPSILQNRSHPEVDLMVVSDGGGVLGIGDQGAGAMLIPVAKLMVYSICGGINPLRTLPIMLDVGTDNEALQKDPLYLGWRHPRIHGEQYDEFIQLFVEAVQDAFPDVFLHWEDFGRDTARRILDNYRKRLCTFNDDIQGTGVVTVAALLSAVQAKKATLTEQRIVVFGAGTAGTGISDLIVEAMQHQGLSQEEAYQRFWLIDRQGLLTTDLKELTSAQQPYARKAAEVSGWQRDQQQAINLMETLKQVKPTVLIGCSTVHGAFNKEVITTMSQQVERPIIFPLSNPTPLAEATPADVINWTNGNVLVATGSPFPPVKHNGKQYEIGQCNNALVFPGIGLGVIAVNATYVSDEMLWVACQTLAKVAPINQGQDKPLLPAIDNAQESARQIGIAVAKQAIREGNANIDSDTEVESLVDQIIWQPNYLPFKLHKS